MWSSLTVNPVPANFDSISGMPYEADLTQVMNSYSDSALIDLAVDLTDSAGNTTEQILHPAFLLRDVVTGTWHEKSTREFSIHPNPTSGKFTLETDEMNGNNLLSLVNLDGQQVFSAQITNQKTQFDINNLPSGVYFLKLVSKKGVAVEKLVKL